MTKEDLLQLSELMDSKLAPINERLDKVDARLDNMQGQIDRMQGQIGHMQGQLDQLQEDSVITRDAVNSLCEWADNVAVLTQIRFPVKKASNGMTE